MNLGAGVMMGDDTEARYLYTSTCRYHNRRA